LLNRVSPDGCADVIIDLGAIWTGSGLDDGRCTYAVGTMRRASRVEVVGNVHLLGVRFRPGAAERFFRMPMHELTDQTIPLSDLWSGAGALERSVRDAQSDAARIRQLEEAVLRRLRSSPEPAATVRGAIGFIGHTGGTRSVRELEQAVGVGGRHLERQFRHGLGVSPKLFSRVVRFRRTLALMRRPQAVAWPRLALEAGYYDQAHMIREIRALSGATPRKLLAE
jgi:AraC-like DNA-binding protein